MTDLIVVLYSKSKVLLCRFLTRRNTDSYLLAFKHIKSTCSLQSKLNVSCRPRCLVEDTLDMMSLLNCNGCKLCMYFLENNILFVLLALNWTFHLDAHRDILLRSLLSIVTVLFGSLSLISSVQSSANIKISLSSPISVISVI